jgi:hypothetical protein
MGFCTLIHSNFADGIQWVFKLQFSPKNHLPLEKGRYGQQQINRFILDFVAA